MGDGDRSVRAFLVAIRTFPGFGLRVAMAACFTAALAREQGVVTACSGVAVTLLAAFAVGYPVWRRLGTRAVR